MISRAIFAALVIASVTLGMSQAPTATNSFIIQGSSLEAVKSAVLAVDGEITHELGVIRAVAARERLPNVFTAARH